MATIENIRDLELFQLVAELGSFTEAAYAAGVSQPAVSLAIKRLETRLGTSLLDRQRFGAGGGVSVTPAGTVLVQHTAAILEHIDRLNSEIGHLSAPEAYRVGLPPIVSAYLLGANSMDALAARLGGDVSVSTVGSQRMLAEMRRHDIDFGAIATVGQAPQISGIETVRIASFPFTLAVSASHALSREPGISFDEAAAESSLRLVTLSRDYVHSQAANAFLRRRIAAGRILEVDTIGAMKGAIAAGTAVGLLASVAVDNDERLRSVSLAHTELPTFDVYLFTDVSRDSASRRPGAQAFLDLVGENLEHLDAASAQGGGAQT